MRKRSFVYHLCHLYLLFVNWVVRTHLRGNMHSWNLSINQRRQIWHQSRSKWEGWGKCQNGLKWRQNQNQNLETKSKHEIKVIRIRMAWAIVKIDYLDAGIVVAGEWLYIGGICNLFQFGRLTWMWISTSSDFIKVIHQQASAYNDSWSTRALNNNPQT